MQSNNKNKFYAFPINKNIGCIGIIIGLLVISILLILFFFIGIWVLGFIVLFYIYRYIKNIFNKKFDINNNKKSDINNNVTEAEYFEVKNDDPENRD
tara:strand:+ start:277 stop:567 length:291 start_codon:yes stop_codon:yes gene_type:complete